MSIIQNKTADLTLRTSELATYSGIIVPGFDGSQLTDIQVDADDRVLGFFDLATMRQYQLLDDGTFGALAITEEVQTEQGGRLPAFDFSASEMTTDGDERVLSATTNRSMSLSRQGMLPTSHEGDWRWFDVIVYGASPSGVMAAVRLARKGYRVCVLEPTSFVGGVMVGGLVASDFPPVAFTNLIKGMTAQWFEAMGAVYGTATGRQNFEPSVAHRSMMHLLNSNRITVQTDVRLTQRDIIQDADKRISSIRGSSGWLHARFFIDASYEGDLMAYAGVPYKVGREAASEFGENRAGFRPEWAYTTDIANTAGLYMVEDLPTLASGDGDDRTQAYSFRLTVTNNASNRLPWTQPAGYDATKFAIVGQVIAARGFTQLSDLVALVALPNQKFDINIGSIISIEPVGKNTGYADGSWATRDAIIAEHVAWEKGFFWYLSQDAAVPSTLRDNTNTYGLCKDEFKGSALGSGFSEILYIREGRRMRGKYVLTQMDQETGSNSKATPALRWKYAFRDIHPVRLYRNPAVPGRIYSEGNLQHETDAAYVDYDIPFECLMPPEGACPNLTVTVCLSTTHVAYAATRMEPAYMMAGEAAAELAIHCIDRELPVQSYNFATVSAALAARVPLF